MEGVERGAPRDDVPAWALTYDAGEYPHYAVTGDAVALALEWERGGAPLRTLVVVCCGAPSRGLDA